MGLGHVLWALVGSDREEDESEEEMPEMCSALLVPRVIESEARV